MEKQIQSVQYWSYHTLKPPLTYFLLVLIPLTLNLSPKQSCTKYSANSYLHIYNWQGIHLQSFSVYLNSSSEQDQNTKYERDVWIK